MEDNITNQNPEVLKLQLEILKFNREIEKENLEMKSKLQKKKSKLRKMLCDLGTQKNGAKNDYDNYQYFSEAQYKELFNPLFEKCGIELKSNEIDYGTFEGTDKQPYGRTVTMSYSLIDVDTGYEETTNHTGEGLDRGEKGGYKGTTGALKRFLSSTFLVATQDDPERDDEKGSPKTKSNSYKKPLNNNKGTITPGQRTAIAKIYKDDVEGLKKLLSEKYKVSKVDQLSMEDASSIIQNSKAE